MRKTTIVVVRSKKGLTHPMWTGAAVTYRQGREISSQATAIGYNASHKDVSFHAIVDTVELARNMLTISPASTVSIYTADHQIILWLLIMDRHDNAAACKAICKLLVMTLFKHLDMTVSISWIPRSANFIPLKWILEKATAEVAAADLANCHTPCTIAVLKHEAKLQALTEWEQVWLRDPHRNPTYRALHHPSSGQLLEFMARIEKFAQLVLCTAI
jgi:hypothetical protein